LITPTGVNCTRSTLNPYHLDYLNLFTTFPHYFLQEIKRRLRSLEPHSRG